MRKATIIGLAAACIAVTSCNRKSIDEQFAEAARQDTQQICPRQVDECTTLDSICYDMTTRTQQFYYTFSGNMDDTTHFTPSFVEDIRETILFSLRNEIKLKKHMEAEIGFSYIYHSAQSGDILLQLDFTKEDYTGPMKMRSFNEKTTAKWKDYTMKHCPEKQDECVTLKSIDYDSLSTTLSYTFLLSGQMDIRRDSDSLCYNEEIIKQKLIESLKEDDTLIEEKKEGIKFNIKYISRSTKETVMNFNIKL